jgi:hypothetical protein
MRVFFIKDIDSSVISLFHKEDKIISLSPGVSYFLSKNNIKHNILTDYYNEEILRKKEKDYFWRQLKWFEEFDNFIKENISFCKSYNINLARSNYLRIKYFIDTLVINSTILHHFFKANQNLEEIIYVSEPFLQNKDSSLFNLKYKNKELFCNLLRLFCKYYNINFSSYAVSSTKEISKKDILSQSNFFKFQIKKIINFLKYKKFRNFFSPSKEIKILFMHAGSPDTDYPIKELIKYGIKIYLKEKDKIIEEGITRKVIPLPSLEGYSVEKIDKECKKCADILEDNMKLIGWINNESSLDISSVVLPFLKYFIAKDCSYILKDAQKMFNFFKENKIDYVFARGNTTLDSQGTLIASKYMKGAKSVCLQHSSFCIDSEVFGVFETETYNYIFVRDFLSEGYYKYSLENRYSTDCKVIKSFHYLKTINKKYFKKIKRKKREKVVYVEKKFLDDIRCFNNMIYPLGWYFEFQKKVIDFFSQQPKFDFVYKHSSNQLWAKGSILQYIKEKKYRNIKIFEKHFLDALKFADRVIVDYPSGAFFESIVSKRPTLCICADYFKIIDKAKNVFGKSLQQFSSIEEAISIIEKFLYADPEEYIVNLDIQDYDFLSAFNSLIKIN